MAVRSDEVQHNENQLAALPALQQARGHLQLPSGIKPMRVQKVAVLVRGAQVSALSREFAV